MGSMLRKIILEATKNPNAPKGFNPVAPTLRQGQFQPKVVPLKTRYDRNKRKRDEDYDN